MLKEKERENRADRILSYTVRTFLKFEGGIWYAFRRIRRLCGSGEGRGKMKISVTGGAGFIVGKCVGG